MDYNALYEEYLKNGCLKIENFITLEEVEELKRGCDGVVESMTEESSYVFSVYGAGKKKEADEYFINSSDKIRYFFENDAFDKEGNMLTDKKQALNKAGYGNMVIDKKQAVGRVGYALHWWNPIFKKHTFGQKIKDLLKNFHYKDPVVVQSMLIFKKPKIGEIVKPHQDSTFLYTEPQSCLGIWFPLEDATLENGCLWFIPGSHKEENIYERFVRNPEKDSVCLMKGKLPEFREDEYVSVPAKRGDCVIIHGAVIHKSGRNSTKTPRTVYTYHVVENDAKWSEDNWCQPSEKLPFPSVYSN